LNQEIKNKIEKYFKKDILDIKNLSGGCISNAYKIELSDDEAIFLKVNDNNKSDGMFIKEAHGLKELAKAKAIRIPKVFFAEEEYLILEYIQTGYRRNDFFEVFGIKFANLHKFHGAKFGFYEDNYIGSNPQKNTPSKSEENNWAEFYFNKRIMPQYQLAEQNGYATNELKKGIKKLEGKIEGVLKGSEERPSLLHGDLWSGNFMEDENGMACLIDPAVYYGHREADLAMTKLFGGFSKIFYDSYNHYFPLKEGYEYRENIYKLYHVMNHLNLFGKGYYQQVISIINYY
jgi:protein-ribulosamine 3-kinase